jgi:hypothetical protein
MGQCLAAVAGGEEGAGKNTVLFFPDKGEDFYFQSGGVLN